MRACPVCHHKSPRHLKSHRFNDADSEMYQEEVGEAIDFTYELYKCSQCGMVYVGNDDRVDMSNEFYRNISVERPEDDSNFPSVSRIESYKSLLGDLQAKGAPCSGQLLDFGCGFGGCMKAAMELGYKVHGIEPCRFRANWTAEQLSVPVEPVFGHEVEMEKLPPFDLLVSDQVFEHLADPLATLDHLRSGIAEGGFLWICTPNYNSRFFHEQVITGHFNYFTPRTLTKLVKRGGFEIVSNKIIVKSHGKVLPKMILRYFGFGTCSVLAKRP